MADIQQQDPIQAVERRPEGQGHGQHAGARRDPRSKAVGAYAEAAQSTHKDDDRITILGIPFEQITPATQAALAGLVAEINYLRGLVKRYERAGPKRGPDEATPVLEPGAFARALDSTLAKETAEGESWVTVLVHVPTYEDIRRSSGVLAANAALADVAGRMREVDFTVDDASPLKFAVIGYAGGSNLAAAIALPHADIDTSAVSARVRTKLLSTGYNVAGIDMALAITVSSAVVGAGESGLLALARTDHLLLRTRH